MAVKLEEISFQNSRDHGKLNRELAKLAEWAGTKMIGKAGAWHYDGEPMMEGRVQGFPFKVYYLMHRAGFGGIIMFPSISLVMELAKPIPYKLKMRNKDGVRLNFYVEGIPEDPGPVTDMPQQLLDEVVPQELREMFRTKELELEYVFRISEKQIVISTYFAYDHKFYVYLLEQMAKMADTLSKLPE